MPEDEREDDGSVFRSVMGQIHALLETLSVSISTAM
jgi:hypothetical protein